MTTQDKIKPLLKDLKLVSKSEPTVIEMDGYVFEISNKYMLVRCNNHAISYKSKNGFSQTILEIYVDDAIKYFRKVKAKKTRRLKQRSK